MEEREKAPRIEEGRSEREEEEEEAGRPYNKV